MATATLDQVKSGTVAKRQLTILDYLDNPKVKDGLGAVAGKFLTADRILRLCVNAVHKTPALLKCDPKTVLGAMMTSAALGLEPNTVQQQAFLIPYKKRVKVGDDWMDAFDCQFQIGARGFVTLAYRSPLIKSITAEAIHERDHWKHLEGTHALLEYSKALRDRGPLLGAFSYVRLQSGIETACVLPLEELHKIRARSETYAKLVRDVKEASSPKDTAKAQEKLDSTPWVMWEDDMAAKSALKKHAKQLPIASNDALAFAAEVDNQNEVGTLDLATLGDPDALRAAMEGTTDTPAALGHEEPQTLVFGDAGAQKDAEPARAAKPAQQRQRRAAAAQEQPAGTNADTRPEPPDEGAGSALAGGDGGAPTPQTPEKYAERINTAKNRDAAAEVLAEASSLLDEGVLQPLKDAFDKRFPPIR